MKSFKAWAEAAVAKVVPKMPLHDALLYALKYWPYVMNVLEDGRLGLDNNISLPTVPDDAQFLMSAA
jgi:hypothetical protein